MKRVNIVILIVTLIAPLLVGGISASLSSSGMAVYATMNKPPLSPPAWLFPIAWTILYLMMGLASYFVVVSDAPTRIKMIGIIIYSLQLAMNFMWSIIFFRWDSYLFAFVWLLALWCIVILCAFRFYGIHKGSAFLLIPYILWLSFAAYLNLGAYLLNTSAT